MILKIHGPTYVCYRKPELDQKNLVILSDLHLSFKHQMVKQQACNIQSKSSKRMSHQVIHS
jgi:hypothetical protein